MFRPSGDAWIAITFAPASSSARGPTSCAAPSAQSRTTVRPASGWSIDRTRWAAYSSMAVGYAVTRPTAPPVGRSNSSSRRRSMAASIASSSLRPPRAKNLMPLSGIGLCDADRTTPKSAPSVPVRKATPGVGSTPSSSTSTPADARPATTAASRNCPEMRVSRPTTASGRCPSNSPRSASTWAAATDRSRARPAVRSPLARPRTPSVPKRRATGRPGPDVSACCTGEPCGPSSDRPSCAR